MKGVPSFQHHGFVTLDRLYSPFQHQVKLFAPMSMCFMPSSCTGQVGIPAPFFMVILVGAMEVIGGALLMIGYSTRIAAALLALNMLGAIITVKFSIGFVNGWEFEAVLLVAALSLVLSGPQGHRVPESKQAQIWALEEAE